MKTLQGFSVAPLLPVAVCLMAGIAVGNWWQPGFTLLPVLVATVIAAFVCHRWAVTQTVAILACCMVLGMTLTQVQDTDGEDIAGRELQGVVMSEPAERPKTIGVDLLVPEAGGRTVRCYLWKDERSRTLRIGDEIVCHRFHRSGEGGIRQARFPTGEDGTGNYHRFHRSGEDGIRQARFPTGHEPIFVRSGDWHPGGKAINQMSRWQRSRLWFLKQRHKLLERYQGFHAGEDTYAVLAAMTLGDKSAQTQELRETYTISGASHILAISGLHVGIVYMLLTLVMLGRRYFWLSQVLTVAAIWAFALLTGLSPSVTRAATMISLYAVFANRTVGDCKSPSTAPLNVLCFAAIIMLIADAQTLFNVSFQLSFSAVAAILLFLPLLRGFYQPHNVILRWVWNVGLLSLCAQLGVAPLIAYYFGRFSTYFLLTNFLVIPAATLILYGALLSLLFPTASIVLIQIVKAMNGGLHIIASLPGASIEGLSPTPLQVALIYLFILLGYLIALVVKGSERGVKGE